ncbi:MAG: XRE family transcriptional regulator [Caulobacteraceae bacterium]|nr:XRE family transcriptional regulator [Caulobacteraceae bacterium]
MTKTKLAALRKKTGLSMQEFGNALGVDRTTIWRWETGSRGIGKFEVEAIERLVASLLADAE